MKEQRILRALGEVDSQYIKEAAPMPKASITVHWKKWLSIAACFTLVIAIGLGIFQSGLFGNKTDIVTLENGEKITLVNNPVHVTSIDLNVRIRKLTDEETKLLFADLPVTANAYFEPDTHHIVGFEGNIGDVKLVVSTSGEKLVDTVIDGKECPSTIAGISVTAGYFLTKPNSRGIKTVIYYATFDIGENTVYVEYSGAETESDTVKYEFVDAILKLIENGEFDLSQIQE